MVDERRVAAHYGRSGLREAILAGLAAAGKPLDRLTLDDLAPLDEFHVRGRAATLELGAALGLAAGMRVLDVGSGLGGPSRRFAADHGCSVIGIDLTDAYCDIARLLAAKVGLEGRVEYRQMNALAMAFDDGTFDAAYSQHVAMNIADKPRLYREIARVLKPGARFGLYDLLQGEGGAVIYPVPWAKTAETSFLATPEELRTLLADAGFDILVWRDTTEEAHAFATRMYQRSKAGEPPPFGMHLLLGEDFPAMTGTIPRNLGERRLRAILAVARRR